MKPTILSQLGLRHAIQRLIPLYRHHSDGGVHYLFEDEVTEVPAAAAVAAIFATAAAAALAASAGPAAKIPDVPLEGANSLRVIEPLHRRAQQCQYFCALGISSPAITLICFGCLVPGGLYPPATSRGVDSAQLDTPGALEQRGQVVEWNDKLDQPNMVLHLADGLALRIAFSSRCSGSLV
ncbi:hypothetical protein QFC24_006464 [Naganishia onofrii]|uniref:Uncharacterized protein n=1 Tax=Naganishia onofrii TaxID=1851511 RepID=A0ACC2X003_9TREE|nr:hypothetical protein QFC24_006464 [Naganishia onofrii]